MKHNISFLMKKIQKFEENEKIFSSDYFETFSHLNSKIQGQEEI
jgi:hypothetical protein